MIVLVKEDTCKSSLKFIRAAILQADRGHIFAVNYNEEEFKLYITL